MLTKLDTITVCDTIADPAGAMVSNYRYGFNGQEKDNEVYNVEDSYVNFEYRGYNTRLGRFMAVDPLYAKYPMYTPYSFAANQPIQACELEGLESSNDKNPTSTKSDERNVSSNETRAQAPALTPAPNLSTMPGTPAQNAGTATTNLLSGFETQLGNPNSSLQASGNATIAQLLPGLGTSNIPANTPIATTVKSLGRDFDAVVSFNNLNPADRIATIQTSVNTSPILDASGTNIGTTTIQTTTFITGTGGSVVISGTDRKYSNPDGVTRINVVQGEQLKLSIETRFNTAMQTRDRIIRWQQNKNTFLAAPIPIPRQVGAPIGTQYRFKYR